MWGCLILGGGIVRTQRHELWHLDSQAALLLLQYCITTPIKSPRSQAFLARYPFFGSRTLPGFHTSRRLIGPDPILHNPSASVYDAYRRPIIVLKAPPLKSPRLCRVFSGDLEGGLEVISMVCLSTLTVKL